MLGRHQGIIHYTIGQRKGLGIGGGEVLFVIKLDAANSQVIVGPREALKQNEILITDVNWLGALPISHEPQKIFARIRSTRAPVAASIRVENGDVFIAVEHGEYGVSPGQACVFYEGLGAGQRVLGGGFIKLEKTTLQRVAFTRSTSASSVSA